MKDAMLLQGVFKHYRKPNSHPFTSLKSFLLRDLWRRQTPQQAAAQKTDLYIHALSNISLKIAKGCTLGIVGSNGSGKSTLLKIMCRILRPDHGSIQINGRVAALIELGAGFHPELTGRENILINGVILGLSKQAIKEQTPSIIEFAELGEFIDFPVRTYSSGMYARLGFAVAIHVDPDILLVDEILSVGDASFNQKCHTALDQFKKKNKTIIMVSHSLQTISAWCDSAIWLHKGQMMQEGAPDEVIAAYENHL